MEFAGIVTKELNVEINHFNQVKEFLQEFANQDVVITIEKYRKSRTQRQNRWYFGICIRKCIIPFIYETQGEVITAEKVHAFHLSAVIDMEYKTEIVMGRPVVLIEEVSTSRMSTVEFNDFKNRIQAYWAEKGLVIPDPIEDNFINDFV